MNSNRDCFMSTECLHLTDWSASLRSFWHITVLHLLKPVLTKLYAWVNELILQYGVCR